MKELQKTAILGTAHILRKVLTKKYNSANAGTSDIDTINSNDRIAETLYSLGTWFVSGIYVKILCIKEMMMMMMMIIFLHGLGRLTCSGIDALPSFPGASTTSSSSRFVVEGVFRQSGVVRSCKMVDPDLFVFGSHVLYSRDL